MYKLLIISGDDNNDGINLGRVNEERYFFCLSHLLNVVNKRLTERYERVYPDNSFMELKYNELTQIGEEMYVTRVPISLPMLRVSSEKKHLKHPDLVESIRYGKSFIIWKLLDGI